MNLRVFNQKSYASNTGKASQTVSSGNTGSTALLNRQIRSLAPGQTLQGEVVSRNGSEVQIRLADDTIMNARLDQNMNLEIGKSMTFEVRSNGRALTLSPLFANVATDANTLKALDMASLPINETTVGMTRLLMEAGLPVDKNSLQQVFREIMSFPDTDISNIIDLHKLGLPVTDENVTQIESYKNLTYQLVTGMNDVIGVLPETLFDMVRSGNVEGAAALYEELLQLVSGELAAMEGAEAENADSMAASDSLMEGAVQEGNTQEKIVITEGNLPSGEIANNGADGAVLTGGVSQEGDATARAQAMSQAVEAFEMTEVSEDAKAASQTEQTGFGEAVDGAGQVVSGNPSFAGIDMKALMQELSDISVKYLKQPIPDNLPGAELLKIAGQMLGRSIAEHNAGLMRELLGSEKLQEAFQKGMERLLTIEPDKVGEPKRVEELYQRLDRQLKGITQALEDAGQTSTKAYQATANLSQNVDFLHQLNQIYTYVQLPLKLQDGNAHGDLYVYTNKRSLAAADGKISALLHLDMEHLGPVDVYVAMQNEKVSTNFYVKDDDMLDFLEEHMDILTERLKNRGYDCKCSMQVRGEKETEEQPEGGVHALLAQEGHMMLAQYAFDVRA
ncbi:MAG: flagellar hook-length control protein FliK [Acetatifactor sp.]|nr:flagellar hook-length control protein FliK [Acetatifactor sp.]